jgi:hypothetical protein
MFPVFLEKNPEGIEDFFVENLPLPGSNLKDYGKVLPVSPSGHKAEVGREEVFRKGSRFREDFPDHLGGIAITDLSQSLKAGSDEERVLSSGENSGNPLCIPVPLSLGEIFHRGDNVVHIAIFEGNGNEIYGNGVIERIQGVEGEFPNVLIFTLEASSEDLERSLPLAGQDRNGSVAEKEVWGTKENCYFFRHRGVPQLFERVDYRFADNIPLLFLQDGNQGIYILSGVLSNDPVKKTQECRQVIPRRYSLSLSRKNPPSAFDSSVS